MAAKFVPEEGLHGQVRLNLVPGTARSSPRARPTSRRPARKRASRRCARRQRARWSRIRPRPNVSRRSTTDAERITAPRGRRSGGSPVASVADRVSDMPAISRLFTLCDEREVLPRRPHRSSGTRQPRAAGAESVVPPHVHPRCRDTHARGPLRAHSGVSGSARHDPGRGRRSLAQLLSDDDDQDAHDDPRADP